MAKVRPDKREPLRELLKNPPALEQDLVIGVGTVHDYRWVAFDDDNWLMFMSNFDGDWDQYIDDFFAVGVGEGFDRAFSHCEGYPDLNAPASVKKEWFLAHTQPAVVYKRAYLGTVKEMWKALDVEKAFQQVLDDPAGAKALAETPALKPLLDHAAK